MKKFLALLALLSLAVSAWAVDDSHTSTNFLPEANGTQSLGSASYKWDANLDSATIATATITTLTATNYTPTLGNTRVNGTLAATGATSLTTTLRVGGALTAASTVAITGVLTPTGGLASARVHGTTNLDGTTSAGVVNINGLATLTRARLTTATVSAGSIDATIIGGTTPAAGAFTSLDASGSAVFIGGVLANANGVRVGGTNGTTLTFIKAGTMSVANDATTGTVAMTGALPGDHIVGWAWRTGNTNGVSLKTSTPTTNSVSVTCANPGAASTADFLVIRY